MSALLCIGHGSCHDDDDDDDDDCVQVTAATAEAAAAALWRCYKDVRAATLSADVRHLQPTHVAVAGRRDAAVLEDVLCGLRQQQLFQLHLLR